MRRRSRRIFRLRNKRLRHWLAADESSSVGLFLQQIPSRQRQRHDWRRVAALADTVTHGELLQLSGEILLYRLFHEEQVRLFEPEAVLFRCSCSRQRIKTVLSAIGRSERTSVDRGKRRCRCPLRVLQSPLSIRPGRSWSAVRRRGVRAPNRPQSLIPRGTGSHDSCSPGAGLTRTGACIAGSGVADSIGDLAFRVQPVKYFETRRKAPFFRFEVGCFGDHRGAVGDAGCVRLRQPELQ